MAVLVEFRFYLFSLMAVFVALGTGLLLGSALPVAETVGRKQMAVVEELRREFRSLREREAGLRGRVQELEEQVRREGRLAEQLLPGLVRGRLAGVRVFLLVSGPAPSEAVEETLALAGATVAGRRVLPAGPAAGEEVVPAVANPAAPPGVPTAGGAGEEVRLLLLVGEGTPALTADAMARLAEEARRRGMPLVAAETSGTRPSLVPVWRRLDVPSVDDADAPAGRLALVALLRGERGHYGVKPSADSLLPGSWEAGIWSGG